MDLVDEIVADWAVQRPDIDCSGKAIVCRILRFYSYYLSVLEKSLKPLGIAPNVFSVLVTIRRKGKRAEINVKTMMQEVLVTSGAMSNLLNRLIDEELITKRPDANDARSMLVRLTPKGLKVIEKAMEIQAACERKLISSLNQKEREQLSLLLKKIQPEDF
jgi:DNA-binding MarR family transcriptional regulator